MPLPSRVQNSLSGLFRLVPWIIELNSEFSFFFTAKPVAVISSGGVVFLSVSVIESTCQCTERGFDPWAGKIRRRRKWQPTPAFLPGKSHGQRNLVGRSPQGSKEWDSTEQAVLQWPCVLRGECCWGRCLGLLPPGMSQKLTGRPAAKKLAVVIE